MKKVIQLNENGLNLRRLIESDARDIFNCIDHKVVEYLSNVPWPYTMKDAENFIQYAQIAEKTHKEYIWGIDKDGIIGIISLKNLDFELKEAEVAYWLSANNWGKGYGSKSLKMVVEYSFNVLMMKKLIANVITENEKSSNMLLKNGFKFSRIKTASCQLRGQIKDEFEYYLTRNPYENH